MAHRVLTRTSRPLIKAYLPNLSAAVSHFRTFCSHDQQQSRNVNFVSDKNEELVWPDKNLGPLANKDHRFPLPGSVGIGSSEPKIVIQPEVEDNAPEVYRPVEPLLDTAVPSRAVPGERHVSVLTEFLANIEDTEPEALSSEPKFSDTLEFVVHDCPQLLRQDFQELFPEKTFIGRLTVITISQKTENDMSGWSEAVEAEREDLLDNFIQGATEICESLQENGFWSDFIDPSSGRPYLSAYTNATLFETDERYRHFGFDIKDLGCCKVISHHLWGSHAYVGCMFTNAPSDHPVLTGLVVDKE